MSGTSFVRAAPLLYSSTIGVTSSPRCLNGTAKESRLGFKCYNISSQWHHQLHQQHHADSGHDCANTSAAYLCSIILRRLHLTCDCVIDRAEVFRAVVPHLICYRECSGVAEFVAAMCVPVGFEFGRACVYLFVSGAEAMILFFWRTTSYFAVRQCQSQGQLRAATATTVHAVRRGFPSVISVSIPTTIG